MTPMRREDRAIPIEEARRILDRAEYGVLSLLSSDGRPYGVPLSFCLIDDALYFHCALDGRKSDGFDTCKSVSFCAVGDTRVMPEKFGTLYESAIAEGTIEELFDEEKQRGLVGLLQKYSPGFMAEGNQYIEAKRLKTRVYRIAITHLTGKARRA